ncbi:MAG: hypothetical protein JHD16_03015 [Solirubrobacteraceae bacterium]|nr:hypothetical protein [Solirubrobacteraceae bacterium]
MNSATTQTRPAIRLSRATLACFGLIGASWFVFLLSGSLAAYWLCVGACVVPTALLGHRRHWAAALAPVAGAALLGTELRAELGTTVVAPFNGLRALDLVVLSAALGVASSSEVLRTVRTGAALRAVVWPWRWVALALAALAALWFAHGYPTDQLGRTDARLIFLAAGAFYTARGTVPGHERLFVMGLVGLGGLVALKAIALHVSDLWAIGTYDRAQATQLATEPKRTILVGGDTLMILVPAAAVALVENFRATWFNATLAAISALCGVAVLLSGTRSSLLVLCLLAVLAPVLCWERDRLPRGRQAVMILVTGLIIVVAATAVSGVASRFVTPESQSEGLGFREDEIRTFLRLPTQDLMIGQGLGGRFTSRDSTGAEVEAAWSHVLPVWVGLKLGLLGLALLTAVGAVAMWRTLRRSRVFGARVGALLFTGLLLMSLTIGRAALPEGVILVACCFILLGWGAPDDPPRTV